MVLPFKKLFSKLEVPKDDWVLSRFGGCEPPSNPNAASPEDLVEGGDEAPVSHAPTSVARRLLKSLFDTASPDEAAVPPQSGARVSSNASDDVFPEDEHKSRAS